MTSPQISLKHFANLYYNNQVPYYMQQDTYLKIVPLLTATAH